MKSRFLNRGGTPHGGKLPRYLVAMLVAMLVLPVATGAAYTKTPFTVSSGLKTGGATQQPTTDATTALVQLRGDPLSTDVRTKPAHGRKIDFNDPTVRSVRAQLNQLRNDFRAWLRANAPNASVNGDYDIALNAVSVDLNGESLSTIAGAPMVERAEYEGLYYPTTDDPDLSIIHATEAWAQAGGPANAGAGVKIAIIDSGIDITHPCFSDAGYPPQQQLGDRHFTNNKVIAAKVFITAHGYTPAPIWYHGTHIAGTAACNYRTGPMVVNGLTMPYNMSGVAPRALLGNYNVFPGDVGFTKGAPGEVVLNALEAAYQDGFDVANMSLGGPSGGIQDLMTRAVNDLDQANMVVAVAGGNTGPGHYTISSPGSAERALTAGASWSNRFFGSAPVTVAGSTYTAATGEFYVVTSTLTAPLAVVTGTINGLSDACSALSVNLTGKIALISRGTCLFSTKIRNTQQAGAIAVLVANNVAGDPLHMFQDGTPNQPTVPAYMVSQAAGQALRTHDGEPATIGVISQYSLTANADIMASFSSQGPTDVTFRVKPDVVAPGVNVLSALPANACATPPCYGFSDGTSMATPHLAGSAAVVIGQHPGWSAAQVRSAIVNTADLGVLKDYLTGTQIVTDPNIQGAGRENLLKAVLAKVSLDPVSISFGAVPSGSGQSGEATLTLTNVSNSAATFTVAIGASPSGVAFSASPSSVTLAPNQSATVTARMQADRRARNGDYSTYLTVSMGGTQVAHAALYTLVR